MPSAASRSLGPSIASILVFLVAVAASRTVRAEPATLAALEPNSEPTPAAAPGGNAPAAVSAPTTGATNWYGLPIVVTDVVSTGLVTVGALTFSLEEEAPAIAMMTGLGGYTLGGPIVHATNGEWIHSGMSLGIRAVPWVLWGALREGVGDEDVGNWTLAAGALCAMIVDSAFVAKRPRRTETTSSFQLLPTVDAARRGASLSLATTF